MLFWTEILNSLLKICCLLWEILSRLGSKMMSLVKTIVQMFIPEGISH